MKETRWVWTRPFDGLDFTGRAAALVLFLSCATNTMLVWSSRDDTWFSWVISISAGVAAAGILTRVVSKVTIVSEYATWLACGMWVANFVEIWTSHVSLSGKFRNGGFYLTFAVMAIFSYFVERVTRRTEEVVT